MENLTIDLNEKSKIFKIKNNLGQIQFIVSFIILEDGDENGKYLVKVREITNLYIPKDIVREFFKEEDKELAIKTTNKLVEDYTTLVKSEKEPIDPRQVFNDEVNYRIINPECCKNCVYAIIYDKPEPDYKEGRNIPPKIFCNCKKNLKQHEYTWDVYKYDEEIIYDPRMLEVSFYGLCNNYVKNENEFED